MTEYFKINYPEEYDLVEEYASDILVSDGMTIEKSIAHHGIVNTYDHSVHVAIVCISLVQKFDLNVDLSSLIRGALLHDYYLYKAPAGEKGHTSHLFLHPRRAFNNAKEDFEINEIEEDIILKHMFPATPMIPKYLESWIVIYADKVCATKEQKISVMSKANFGAK